MPATSGASGPGMQKLRLLDLACWTRAGKSSAEIEVTLVHFGVLGECQRLCGGLTDALNDLHAGDLPSSPSIARHDMNAFDLIALSEFPGEGVFSTAIADEQYS